MNADIFASLAEYAVENDQEELLSTPLAELLHTLAFDEKLRRVLEAELKRDKTAVLDDITRNSTTRLRVVTQLKAREVEQAAAMIQDWITQKLNEAEEEAARLAAIKKPNRGIVEKRAISAEPPEDHDSLLVWAKRRRVAHLLQSDARELISPAHQELAPLYGYQAVNVSGLIVDPHYTSRTMTTQRQSVFTMRDEVLRALTSAGEAFEEAAKADEVRLKGLHDAARSLESGRQMRFARALLELRAELQKTVCVPLPTTTPPAIELLINPPRVEANVTVNDVRYGPHRGSAIISINLLSLGGDKLSVQGSHVPLAVIVFIDAVLAALFDPAAHAHGSLTLMIERPAWAHALDALELATETQVKEEKPKAILSWRVSFSNYGARFVPCVHKPLKRGGFSAGTESDVDKVRRLPDLALLPADTAMLRAVRERERTQHFNSSRDSDYPLLELLIGHPRVYAAEAADALEPLTIVRAQLGLSLVTAPDGNTRIVAAIGDKVVATNELRAASTYRHDPATHTVELVQLTPEQVKLLSTISLHDVAFPAEAQAALLERVARLSHIAPVTLPEAMRGEEIEPITTPTLRLTPQAQALDLELIARPLGAGVAMRPGSGNVEISGIREGRRVHTRRDLLAERKAANAMIDELGLDLDLETPRTSIIGDVHVLTFLERLRDAPGAKVEWTRDPMSLSRPMGASALKVKVRASSDWFGLEGEIDLDGEPVHLALVLDALRRGERYVKIGAQKWMALEQSLRDRLAFLAEATHETKEGLEIGNYAAESIQALLDAGAQGEIDKDFTAKIDRIRAADLTPQALPAAFEGELRPYQVEGFQWLCRLEAWGVGGVLADDMGLGKTIQALAMLVRRAPLGATLVVAPTSLIFNWQREAAKFAPSLRVRSYREEGVPKDLGPGDVLLASYGLLTRDTAPFADVPLATLVIDEAQAIKNADTQRAKAMRAIKADWTIALTGTPLENHLADLWSLFRVVTPGFLGSWDRFRDRFATPIERHGSTEKRRLLSRLVRPFLLRRTKSKVLDDLPAKTDIDVNVELSEGEKALYEQARLAAVARIKKAEGDARFIALAALTTLRRLVCHPRLYDEQSTLSSSKLETFLRMIDELRENHHRALVFSQFTTHLALIQEALDARGIAYQYLDGQTPERERSKRVDAFQRGEGLVFLVSLKAGGTGLNLTAADYVFHLDPWWNPAVEEQASSRAHRMGQTRPVTVYRLIARGTVEEKIVALHRDKRELAEALIGESDAASKVMSANEIVSLLQER